MHDDGTNSAVNSETCSNLTLFPLEQHQSMLASRWTALRYYDSLPWNAVWSRCRWQSTSAAPSSISPALLRRARAFAAEHAQLAKQLNSEYDTQLARKAGSLSAVAKALNGWESANNVCSTSTNILQYN